MSVLVQVQGVLFRRAEKLISKAGKPYVRTKIRATSGNELQFWAVTAFSDTAQTELLRLDIGDALAVQGPVKIDQYERDGEMRLSFSVVADHVLALRQPPRKREKAETKARPATPMQPSKAPVPFDDDLPF